MIFLCLLGISTTSFAQEADSTERSFFLNPKPRSFSAKPHSERQAGTFSLPKSGVLEVPDETRYYQFPFKEQHYLDLAVEAYREEIRKQIGAVWLNSFFRAIAPFVNNRFGYGFYGDQNLPVVDRDNPLFQSYQNSQKRQ